MLKQTIVNRLLNQESIELSFITCFFFFFEMEFKPLLIFILLALAVVAESEAVDGGEKKVLVESGHHIRRLGTKYINYDAMRANLKCQPGQKGCQSQQREKAHQWKRSCTRATNCARITGWRLNNLPERERKG